MTRRRPWAWDQPTITIPASELRPGDIITSDSDDVTVATVETIGDGGLPGQGATVRYSGHITRGYGSGHKRPKWWTGHADQTYIVIRP